MVAPGIVLGVSLLIFARYVGFKTGFTTLLFGHTLLALPYCTFIIISSLARFDRTLEDAARGLGAGHRLHPCIGYVVDDLRQHTVIETLTQLRRLRGRAGGVLLQDMLGQIVGLGGEPLRAAGATGPGVVEVERRAVVNGLHRAAPDQQIGVAPAAVDVGGEGIQPQDPTGEVGRRQT